MLVLLNVTNLTIHAHTHIHTHTHACTHTHTRMHAHTHAHTHTHTHTHTLHIGYVSILGTNYHELIKYKLVIITLNNTSQFAALMLNQKSALSNKCDTNAFKCA